MNNQKKTQSPESVLAAVKYLLASGNVHTQESMRLSLTKQGIETSQSKISRLLRKLNAVKRVNHHGESVYSLPIEPVPPAKHSALGELVVDILANETMIVIRTNPGSASLIARFLDHNHRDLDILGTLAGDDTLFVVPVSLKHLKKLTVYIKRILDQ